jgi:dTDP-4-dehydrorhamnose reductase
VTRVLLAGGAGRLGSAIRERWTDCEIIAPPHEQLDIENGDRLLDALQASRPDFLVNAAAFHDVDRCEAEPLRAFAVNAIAVGRAARIARDAGATFVTFSTDYVFDGATDSPYAETDAPQPLSMYGVSKLAGEYLAESSRARVFIVRTCGLYGASASRRSSFIERVLRGTGNGTPLRVVADVIASPTFAGDLADALRALIATHAFGLYHVVDDGAVSWYDFALEAKRQAGAEVAIEPIAATSWKAVAVRPKFSALSIAKLAGVGISMPSWRAGIAAYLRHAVR